MSDNQKHEQRHFAINGIKNTGFYYTKSLVDGKYKLPILYCLQLDGPTRYNELQRKMETATFRSLSKALKELEVDGLIIRKDYGEIPPRVEYSLSEENPQNLYQMLSVFGDRNIEMTDKIMNLPFRQIHIFLRVAANQYKRWTTMFKRFMMRYHRKRRRYGNQYS